MPGREKFIPDSGQRMLDVLENVHNDLDKVRAELTTGETDQASALDRALVGLQELVGVIEPLARAYRRVHG
ncbi:MAG: hypothetical protein ACJ72L_14150 [Marmoricola sp.]